MISLNLTPAQLWALAAGLALALLAAGLLWQWATDRLRRRLRVGDRVTVRVYTQRAGRWGHVTSTHGTVEGVYATGVVVRTPYGPLAIAWGDVSPGGTVNHYALDRVAQP